MKIKIYISILLIAFFSVKIYAQKIELKVSFNDTLLKPAKLITYNNSLSLQELSNEITSVINQLQQNGFLIATTDSIVVDSSFFHVFIRLGKTYQWTSLKNKNIDEEILSKIGFRDKLYNNKPFREKQLKTFFNKIILF